MKLSDITVGSEYAATKSPASTRSRYGTPDIPRQVRVVEIVESVEKRYQSYRVVDRKVRRIKVVFLDEPVPNSYLASWPGFSKGSEHVLESRQIIAPWADAEKDVREQTDALFARKHNQRELDLRLRELGFEGTNGRANEHGPLSINFYGIPDVKRVLELLEAGLLVEKAQRAS